MNIYSLDSENPDTAILKKAGKIIRVILYFAGDYLHLIDFCGSCAGNRSAVSDALLLYHFDAAGGVVGGN